MFVGVSLFLGVVIFLIKDQIIFTIDTENLLIYVVPFVAVSVVSAGQAFAAKQLNELEENLPLEQKLATYRTSLIIKLATIEGPTLLSIVALYLTEEAVYGGIAIVLLTLMLLHKPSKEKIILDLSLNRKDIDQM